MLSRASLLGIVFGIFMLTAFPTLAVATSPQSEGIKVSILKKAIDQRKIIFQFMVFNTTDSRVYFQVPSNETRAFLGSGSELDSASIVGVATCGNVPSCLSSGNGVNDLTHYSYLEPNQSLAMQFTWRAGNPVNSGDTIAFSITAIVKISLPNHPAEEVGPTRVLRFSFPPESVN